MALLAIQGMAMSTAAAALPSHNHDAVSSSVSTSSYALGASAAFPRVRAAFAVGAVTSAAVTPVLDGKLSSHLVTSFLSEVVSFWHMSRAMATVFLAIRVKNNGYYYTDTWKIRSSSIGNEDFPSLYKMIY